MANLKATYTSSNPNYPSGVFNYTNDSDTFMSLASDIEYGIGKTDLLTIKLEGELNGTVWSGGLFESCTSLTSVDMSECDTSNLSSFSKMFNGCSSLVTCNMENVDTTNATSFLGMFQNCSQLLELNLDSFEITNVTNFGYMFNNCRNLQTIYCNNDWSSNSSQSTSMFNSCSSLSGGISYDSTKTTILYAKPNTGYFTNIVSQSNFIFNGNNVQNIYFNGQQVNNLYFNGNKIYEYLPVGYKECKYIESTGTQYIDTNILYDSSKIYDITAEMSFANISSSQLTGWDAGGAFGVQSSCFYNGDKYSFPVSENVFYKINLNINLSNSILRINDNPIYTRSHGSLSKYATNKGYTIFTTVSKNSYMYYLYSKLKYLKIKVDDTLVRDYIPVLDNNNTPCLYDLVTKQTYYNRGTGTFEYELK